MLSSSIQSSENEAKPPVIVHKNDVKIKVPGVLEMLPEGVEAHDSYLAYFDGGSANKLGTIGYVVYNEKGELWFGGGRVLPPH